MSRWQPLRAGISNVWRYYDEVFVFDRGRLLLRGPNGSGKSKALEVLLPYLLDASTQPSRLSTFGTTARTMHWNLMGEGANGRTRVGFVWLELGDGDGRRITIGARLQASISNTRVEAVYFTTTASVGSDLHLADDQGAPLTVAALKEALGDRGKVYAKPGEYRTAVRELLFPAMTADRYNTLVQALLQLRRPKLSEHLDPEALSGLLSSALPPVDELRIAELAEGFERLDQQRAHLGQLERQEQVARDLVTAVRRYGRAEIRRHATVLTQATSTLDKTSAEVRHGQEGLDRQRETALDAGRLAAEAGIQQEELSGAKEALERSEAYAEGRNLADLRERVADARKTADRSGGDAGEAEAKAAASHDEAERDRGVVEGRRADLAGRTAAVEQQALAAGLVAPGDLELPAPPVLAPPLEPSDEGWSVQLLNGVDELDARDRSRRDQLDRLCALLDQHDEAVAERARREAEVDSRGEQLEAAQQLLVRAVESRDQGLLDYEAAVLRWLDEVGALALERSAVEAALDAARDAWTSADTEVPGLSELVAAARDEVLAAASARGGELSVQRGSVQAEHDRTEAERSGLANAAVAEPARAAWRDAPAGGGVPLWRLVDAAPGVADDALAGVEAALQASGLLDAWVFPDGEVRLDGHDVVLGAGAPVPAAASLADLLHPDVVGQPVRAEVVEIVLRGIGLGGAADDAGPWVAADGRWRFGVQHGHWSKPAAQFIGAAARERYRQERLAQLAEKLAGLEAELAAIDTERRDVAARAAQARSEARALPSDTPVRSAVAEVALAETVVQTRENDHAAAVEARRAAERLAASCWLAVEAEAAQSRLPVHREDLRRLGEDLAQLLHRTSELRGELSAYLGSLEALWRTVRRAEGDQQQAVDLRQRAATDDANARRLEAELSELDATRGAEFRDVQARIRDLTRQIGEQIKARRAQEDREHKANVEIAKLAERLRNAEAGHRGAGEARDAALDQFAWIMGTYLADAVDLGVSVDAERVRPTLDLARQLLRELPAERLGVSELLSQMTEKMRQSESTLADRAQLELNPDLEREVMIPSAVHGGRRTSVHALLDTVAAERARTKAEITEGELALFHRILTGDTRRHLSSRIRDAGDLVAGMNRRLAAVRTSSQVRVRLVWEVRKDEGEMLARARELLLTAPERLSEADEQALARFLQERIAQAREADDGLPWAQQLAKVFDYTGWHQFRVQMARGENAEWKPLTRQVHSALSGGEKAIALHLPLFAALAAHYEATPGAPRLILLDEVFVGIDTPNRGQIFGLLTELDFDLVLTSDHEWAAYPQIDGIAIHALATDDADDAVTSTRFVWTGTEMVEDPMADGMLL